MTRVIGTLARLFSVLGLGLIGGLHLLWATGSTWPATDERELADAVAGTRRMPPPGACGAVGGLLIGAATIVATPRGGFASIVRFGTASALAARAAAGGEIATEVLGMPRPSTRFIDLDRRLYVPLCAVLAVCVALSGRGRRD